MKIYIILIVLLLFLSESNSRVIKLDEAKKILEELGFTNGKNGSELSVPETEKALKKYQEDNDINETGLLDNKTQDQLTLSRCNRYFKNEGITSNPWSKLSLTYKIVNSSKPISIDYKKIIENAFELWANKTPLKFNYTDKGTADIVLQFTGIDGPENIVAYASTPPNSEIFFDDGENWTNGTVKDVNLFQTAVHQIGHSLGLLHSENKRSVMYPYLIYKRKFKLHSTDVENIQELYSTENEIKSNETACALDNINAVFSPDSNIVYVIKNKECWKFNNRRLVSGYPHTVEAEWKMKEPIDAAYFYDDVTYFISGKNIYYYTNGELANRLINSSTLITAAMVIKNELFFFAETQYWVFTKNNTTVSQETGYPKPISSFWKGIPNALNGVFNEDNTYIYFFKKNIVYKFNMNKHTQIASVNKINNFFNCTN